MPKLIVRRQALAPLAILFGSATWPLVLGGCVRREIVKSSGVQSVGKDSGKKVGRKPEGQTPGPEGLPTLQPNGDCINCGACEPECPNRAIAEGELRYEFDPDRCNLCVGFFDQEACVAVCPTECCLPDPRSPLLSEGELLDRARRLNPAREFPALADLPATRSLFRKR